ncbi:MAG: rod shape-determining protein MreD [Melioribacteraceae bacterium]|nr:rod shape-determining protein MreD [Melioribacteraceae bacterium]
MRLEYIFPILLFIPIAILQMTIVPFLTFSFIAPDLIMILVIYFALRDGQMFGMVLGFVLGLLFDLFSGSLLGGHMFAYTLTGFIAGYFYNENKTSYNINSFFFLFIVFICASIGSIANSFFSSPETNISIIYVLFDQGLLPGIYTAVVALPVVLINPGKRMI